MREAILTYIVRLRQLTGEIDALVDQADETEGLHEDVSHWLIESRFDLGNVLTMLTRAADAVS